MRLLRISVGITYLNRWLDLLCIQGTRDPTIQVFEWIETTLTDRRLVSRPPQLRCGHLKLAAMRFFRSASALVMVI